MESCSKIHKRTAFICNRQRILSAKILVSFQFAAVQIKGFDIHRQQRDHLDIPCYQIRQEHFNLRPADTCSLSAQTSLLSVGTSRQIARQKTFFFVGVS